jgi:hypothetical protein
MKFGIKICYAVRPPSGNRTVVFIQKQTNPGQDLFIRGGIDHTVRPGCVENAATSPCALPMKVKFNFLFKSFDL